jgi:hypothetical protein
LIAISSGSAHAGRCPLVTVVLDGSGSMDISIGGGSSLTRWDVAIEAVKKLLASNQNLPWGLVTFGDNGTSCTDFSNDVVVPPATGGVKKVTMEITTLGMMPAGGPGTNTGEAIDKGNMISSMVFASEPDRPGQYMILITDGSPNCNSGDSSNAAFTTARIAAALQKGIKTFVVGFGGLTGTAATNMEAMAGAGGVPCMGAACNGNKWYAADSAATLQAALDAIAGQIIGEFQGGFCDDSCYSNGCPNAGEVCVKGVCKPDPCANHPPCAPGDYCYTDGTSPGTCVRSCSAPCANGEVCGTNGMCQPDPCATASCGTGQVCKEGNCVEDKCSMSGCEPGFICHRGACIDDPCRYVKCPEGHSCVTGTGACAALGSSGGPGGNRNRGGGCEVAPSSAGWQAWAALALVAIAVTLRLRRNRS